MSDTKKQIILDAYASFGYVDYFYNADAEQNDFALRILNRMLAGWETKGISIGYNYGGDIQDDSGVPDYASDAVVANLAVSLAGNVGKQLSQDAKQNAINTFNNLFTMFLNVPIMPTNPLMPAGQGRRVYSTDASNFLNRWGQNVV
jgi:hypothetical protein